jgi:hypothetical protein
MQAGFLSHVCGQMHETLNSYCIFNGRRFLPLWLAKDKIDLMPILVVETYNAL